MYTEYFESVDKFIDDRDKSLPNVQPIFRKRKVLNPGDKFGSRTVIQVQPNRINGHIMVEVMCDCGKVNVVQKGSLIHQGRSCIECGEKKPRKSGKENPNYKHGASIRSGDKRKGKRDPVYNIWVAMRQRCHDENDTQYKDYGGRGIFIVEEWNEFDQFKQDMGDRPYGYQIDRIDNNGPYSKENCRWVDYKTQCNNRRNNRIHEIDGEKICHTQLLSAIGYNRDKFRKMEENKKRGLEEAYNAYRALKRV